jgi:hypothetical protein
MENSESESVAGPAAKLAERIYKKFVFELRCCCSLLLGAERIFRRDSCSLILGGTGSLSRNSSVSFSDVFSASKAAYLKETGEIPGGPMPG